MGKGEKNRPSNGLARISAHPRPPKKLKPAASGTRFTDWIGGVCYADTLQIWFPADWAPLELHQLQHKEDEYRAANPSWMDQDDVPDDIRINNLRRVVGDDFHHIRKKYDVPSMWGNVRPRWRLLQQHLETQGPGWYSLAEREERLFTNRSNRPGDDMKDELRTDNDSYAWSTWRTAQDQLWQLRQPAPPVEFPGEQGMLTSMYAQVREEEQVISLQFVGSQQDVSKCRRKKRKQVDDGTAIA